MGSTLAPDFCTAVSCSSFLPAYLQNFCTLIMHRSICYTPFTYYVELVPAFRPHSGTLVHPKVHLSLNVVSSSLFHSSPSCNVTGFNLMPCPSISPSPACAPTVDASLSLRFLLQVSYQHSRCFQPSNTVRPLSYGWARNSLCKNPRITFPGSTCLTPGLSLRLVYPSLAIPLVALSPLGTPLIPPARTRTYG